MGGWGSGRWVRRNRKNTVEESLVLDIDGFRPHIGTDATGIVTCTRTSGAEEQFAFRLSLHSGQPLLTLIYRLNDQQHIQHAIRFRTSRTNHAGRRFWFACPITKGTTICGRRSGKLYLPPNGKLFGCRDCHRLTYQSCQSRVSDERFAKRIDCMKAFLERRIQEDRLSQSIQ